MTRFRSDDGLLLPGMNVLIFLLGILTVIAVGVVLLELRSILLPFVIAVLLSNTFKPIVDYFERKSFPTFIGLIAVLLTFGAIITLLGLLMLSSLDSFVQGIGTYEENILSIISGATDSLRETAARFGFTVEQINWQDAIQLSAVTSSVTSGVGGFVGFFGDVFMVVLFMIFILAGSGSMRRKMEIAFSKQAGTIADIVKNIDEQVRQYLLMKTLISLATGILTWLILLVLGVDFPVVWGLIAFMLNYIPNVGSMIGTLFPFLFAIMQFNAIGYPLLVLALLMATQTVMGNIVEPRVMARSLDLSPVLVLVSLIFWGWLWGITGMVLAVPLTAIIKIVFYNIPQLRPLSDLMGDRLPEETPARELPGSPEPDVPLV